MISRTALTKIFLQQWGKSIDDANVQLFSRKWWQSTRVGKDSAFRLSDEGYEFLVKELQKLLQLKTLPPVYLLASSLEIHLLMFQMSLPMSSSPQMMMRNWQ